MKFNSQNSNSQKKSTILFYLCFCLFLMTVSGLAVSNFYMFNALTKANQKLVICESLGSQLAVIVIKQENKIDQLNQIVNTLMKERQMQGSIIHKNSPWVNMQMSVSIAG